MNAPIPTERQEQRAILKMIGLSFPKVIYHHSAVTRLVGTPKQRGMQMGALKGDGFKSGFPDLVLLWPAGKCAFLEVKRSKGGKVSPEQAKFHETLVGMGHLIAVVTGTDEAYMTMRRWGAPWNGIDPRLCPVADEYHPQS